MITEKQHTDFYNGFVEAMLWATGGHSDYREPPAGYETRYDAETELWRFTNTETGYSETGYDSQWDANQYAYSHAGIEPGDMDDLTDFELADITVDNLKKHCLNWAIENAELLQQYARNRDGNNSGCASVWAYAGHDFFLTSNGHGVGFWDRGLGELGDKLTAACRQFEHKHEPYIGDDGLVYVSGMES